MDEQQVLRDAMTAHMPALLHGSEDAARTALFEMQDVCRDDFLFASLCWVLAGTSADALREMRAMLPAPSRDLPFFPVLEADMSQAERVASQLIAAAANDDRAMMRGFIVSAASWTDETEIARFVTTLGVRGRVTHQRVCHSASRDARGGA